jgi:hypothetical protein
MYGVIGGEGAYKTETWRKVRLQPKFKMKTFSFGFYIAN